MRIHNGIMAPYDAFTSPCQYCLLSHELSRYLASRSLHVLLCFLVSGGTKRPSPRRSRAGTTLAGSCTGGGCSSPLSSSWPSPCGSASRSVSSPYRGSRWVREIYAGICGERFRIRRWKPSISGGGGTLTLPRGATLAAPSSCPHWASGGPRDPLDQSRGR